MRNASLASFAFDWLARVQPQQTHGARERKGRQWRYEKMHEPRKRDYMLEAVLVASVRSLEGRRDELCGGSAMRREGKSCDTTRAVRG